MLGNCGGLIDALHIICIVVVGVVSMTKVNTKFILAFHESLIPENLEQHNIKERVQEI